MQCGHTMLRCEKVKVLVTQSCPTLWDPMVPKDMGPSQAPLSMEFSRQEDWHGLPFYSSRNLSDPGIEPGSPALQVDSLPSESPGKPITVDHDKIK